MLMVDLLGFRVVFVELFLGILPQQFMEVIASTDIDPHQRLITSTDKLRSDAPVAASAASRLLMPQIFTLTLMARAYRRNSLPPKGV
jgi:hypothetical protein